MGEQTSEGFLILKEYKISDTMPPSTSPFFINHKRELIEKGIIIGSEFAEDNIFSSPSYAAAIVMGRNANGLTE